MVALTLITLAIGVTIVLMISQFKSDTRRNLRVINNQIKKLQRQIGEPNVVQAEAKVETAQAVVKPVIKKEVPKENLETSGQKYVPKSVLDKIQKEHPPKEKPPVIQETKPAEKITAKEKIVKEEKVKAKVYTSESAHQSASKVEAAKQAPPKKTRDYEKLIGENWLNKIGIAILVIGVGFFVKYAIDQNWINEVGRVGIGMLVGGTLIGIAHFLRKKYRAFSSVLIGGGISVFYYTISIAYHYYDIFSHTQAFSIMVGITIVSTVLAIIYDRKELAIIALIGGFTTPFMVQGEYNSYNAFFTYIAILNSGFLALSYFKKWNILNRLALGFTTLFFGFWIAFDFTLMTPSINSAMMFASIFFIQFVGMSLLHNLRKGIKFTAYEFVQLLSVSALYYGAMMYLLNDIDQGSYQGIFTLAMACFYLVITILIRSLKKGDENLFQLMLGKVVTFVTLSVLVLFDGDYVTYFWSIEAVLLLWIGQRSKMPLLRNASVFVLSFALVALVRDWATYYVLEHGQLAIIWNKAFTTSMVVLLAGIGYFFQLKKQGDDEKLMGIPVSAFRMLLGGALIAIAYLSTLFELLEQIGRIDYKPGRAQVPWIYHGILLVGGMAIARLKRMELLTQVFYFAGVVGCLAYVAIAHKNNLIIRNDLLSGVGEQMAFYGHYIISGLMLLLLFIMRKSDSLITESPMMKSMFLMGLSLMGMFILSSELDHFAIFNFAHDQADIARVLHHTQGGGYTVLWGIYSFVLMIYGMRNKEKVIRIFSLGVFAVTLVKLFAFDISSISEGGKIAAFISLGILLLVISFLYQKLKNLIVEGSFEGDENETKDRLDSSTLSSVEGESGRTN